MDELEQPSNRDRVNNNSSPRVEDIRNRIPVSLNGSIAYDEIDKPIDSSPMYHDYNGEKIRQRQEIEILTSISHHDELPSPRLHRNDIKESEEKLEEMDLKIGQEIPSSLSPQSTLDDAIDGPPRANPVSPTIQTDDPLPAQSECKVLVQIQSKSTTTDGIVFKYTTYQPKPVNKKLAKYNTSVDYASQIYSDNYYKMDCFPRGKLTLINVRYFTKASGMSERKGTDIDANKLTGLFLDMGFIVDRFDNPSKKEILAIMKAAANENYSDKACCACAILSHGKEGKIYGNDGEVNIKDITGMFQTVGLAGKPKFFLFQACRGSEYMNSFDTVDGPPRKKEEKMVLALPLEADFMYAYSTVPGYYSWRNEMRGSWFVEALVQVFRDNAHKMDVMRMLMGVNDIISVRKSRSGDIEANSKSQIASIITQMRKDFFMFPPYGPLPKQSYFDDQDENIVNLVKRNCCLPF